MFDLLTVNRQQLFPTRTELSCKCSDYRLYQQKVLWEAFWSVPVKEPWRVNSSRFFFCVSLVACQLHKNCLAVSVTSLPSSMPEKSDWMIMTFVSLLFSQYCYGNFCHKNLFFSKSRNLNQKYCKKFINKWFVTLISYLNTPRFLPMMIILSLYFDLWHKGFPTSSNLQSFVQNGSSCDNSSMSFKRLSDAYSWVRPCSTSRSLKDSNLLPDTFSTSRDFCQKLLRNIYYLFLWEHLPD